MSSIAGMTPDERKLQPAYEDVSAGRYKSAESAVTRHLKKNPKSQAALTLRFVLHEKQNAPEATWQKSLKEATKETPNARSLWWITMSLRNLRRLDVSLNLHQDLWKQYPDSGEVGEQVFLIAVAIWDTKVMAESSRKMFNGAKDEIWARLAAWSEWANKAPQPTPSQPYPPPAPEGSLKIASILLSTAGPTIPTSDILWLKFQILLSSGEHRKCHDLLMEHGKGGSLARDWYRMKGIEELAKRETGEKGWLWEKELGEFLESWTSDNLAYRNYAYYQHSISASKVLLSTQPELVKTFIAKLDHLHDKYGSKERAPLLARLELDLELAERSDGSALNEANWQTLVTEYWTRWGSKGSIVPELEAIVGTRRAWMQELMEKRIAEGQDDERSYRSIVNSHLYILRQKPRDWKPSEQDLKLYWQLYLDGLIYGRNLPATDVQPADEIGLATVQLVLSTQTSTASLRAILCLEYILSRSPSCAYAKFLLIRLYRLVGALSLVKPLLEDLKPSEVQLDTLMHLWIEGAATDAHLAPVPRGAAISAWEKWTEAMMRMYDRSSTDLPEYVKQAVEHGSFSKIHSIRSLAQTLAHSQTHASLILEKARFDLHKAETLNHSKPVKDMIGWKVDEMEDTRNWELMPSIGGARTSVDALTRLSETGPEALKRQAALLASLGGEPINVDVDVKMSGSDDAFYTALNRISKRVNGGDEPLTGLFDGLLHDTEQPTRWSILHHGVHMYELATALQNSSNILETKSKKGQTAKSKEQKLIIKELNDTRSVLKSRLKPLIGKLNGFILDDRELNWEDINAGLIDTDFVGGVGKRVCQARVEALEKLKSLLEGL